MLSPRELRRRIKSISSTSQITRAMQMVAASKMRKAQQTTLVTRPFARLLYRIQRRATTAAIEFIHPLLEVREVRKRAVILIGTVKGLKIPGVESEGDLASDTNEVLFEPSPETVLSYLLGHYLNIFIYRVLLEAKASEQSARMVAMKNATDSATNLTEELTLEYNKLRQGNITKELLEIAGGQLGND